MDTKRAMEIYSSKENFPVKLEGQPIWIENVDESSHMATVRIGMDPLNTATVSVYKLKEE